MLVTGKMQLEKLYVAIKLGRARTVQSIAERGRRGGYWLENVKKANHL